MKTKLLRKWRKICCNHSITKYFFAYSSAYFSKLGDKFFEQYARYSRYWTQIKIECDLHCCTTKGMHRKDHPLHHFCPSFRLRNQLINHHFVCDIDFSLMYL